jgi:DNA (cytosine-5)-methyltransferase 1
VTLPAYTVPTMTEIRDTPWNGYVVASLFAGGGGSSTGYRMAGYRVAYMNDVVPEARDTYRANSADYTVIDGADVRTVKGATILDAVEALTGRRELDVLDGSPPCQAFSTAGPRQKTWGHVAAHADGTTQRSDDLFFEYTRLLDEIHPAAFVAENVSGLLKGMARGYFKRILAALQEPGYVVEAKLLDAQWLGIPQMRQRVIFQGVRQDLAEAGIRPAFPTPLPYRYPLATVCPGIVRLEVAGYGKIQVDDTLKIPSRTLTASGYSSYSRDYWLVDAAGHRRKFEIDELKAIGSFPPDYVLTGTYAQQWTRIGNSVPPMMMRAVAAAVRDQVLTPWREHSDG